MEGGTQEPKVPEEPTSPKATAPAEATPDEQPAPVEQPSSEQARPVQERKSVDERKAALARQVQMMVVQGRRIESQSDYRAVMVRKQWGVLDKREIVEVDEWGNVNVQRL